MTLLWLPSGGGARSAVVEQSPDASGEIALDAALCFTLVLPSLIRRSTHSRVGEWHESRVIITWCSARLRCLSPLWLSRKRVTCPLLVGSGLVPAGAANAASDRIRPG
jgi:hypothetical protein